LFVFRYSHGLWKYRRRRDKYSVTSLTVNALKLAYSNVGLQKVIPGRTPVSKAGEWGRIERERREKKGREEKKNGIFHPLYIFSLKVSV